MVESLPLTSQYLYQNGIYGMRYPKSVEEMFLSENPSNPPPIEQMIDSLMEDINSIVFNYERELVADL
jgi:hypothetical protein